MLVAIGICASAVACSKKEDAAPSAAASAAAPASGCGSDYESPNKEFCLKLPAAYKPLKPSAPSSLYSLDIKFDKPDDAQGVHVLVGAGAPDANTYAEQLKEDDEWLAAKTKVESSGPMPGTGKWWQFTNQGYKSFKALVKSNDDKPIFCTGSNTEPSKEVMDICKTLRAYPK
jgi:hypothetical protein